MPTATVITTPFAAKARREAEVFGIGDLPLVVVAHVRESEVPIGQMPSDGVRAIAAQSVGEISFALTAPAADVAATYHRRTVPAGPEIERRPL